MPCTSGIVGVLVHEGLSDFCVNKIHSIISENIVPVFYPNIYSALVPACVWPKTPYISSTSMQFTSIILFFTSSLYLWQVTELSLLLLYYKYPGHSPQLQAPHTHTTYITSSSHSSSTNGGEGCLLLRSGPRHGGGRRVLTTSRAVQNSAEDFVSLHNAACEAVGVGPVSWDDNMAAFAKSWAAQLAGGLVHSSVSG
jgi:hypothetical protein